MKARKGAAALMAAAAMAAPASASQRGTVTQQQRTLAPILPGPLVEPAFAVAPENGGTYYDPDTNTINSARALRGRELAHERAHAFDRSRFTDADRLAVGRIIEAGDGPWWGEKDLGPLVGRPSPSEVFADYYAAAATNFDPRPRRKGRVVVGSSGPEAYSQIRRRRLALFRQFMDQWARAHMVGAK